MYKNQAATRTDSDDINPAKKVSFADSLVNDNQSPAYNAADTANRTNTVAADQSMKDFRNAYTNDADVAANDPQGAADQMTNDDVFQDYGQYEKIERDLVNFINNPDLSEDNTLVIKQYFDSIDLNKKTKIEILVNLKNKYDLNLESYENILTDYSRVDNDISFDDIKETLIKLNNYGRQAGNVAGKVADGTSKTFNTVNRTGQQAMGTFDSLAKAPRQFVDSVDGFKSSMDDLKNLGKFKSTMEADEMRKKLNHKINEVETYYKVNTLSPNRRKLIVDAVVAAKIAKDKDEITSAISNLTSIKSAIETAVKNENKFLTPSQIEAQKQANIAAQAEEKVAAKPESNTLSPAKDAADKEDTLEAVTDTQDKSEVINNEKVSPVINTQDKSEVTNQAEVNTKMNSSNIAAGTETTGALGVTAGSNMIKKPSILTETIKPMGENLNSSGKRISHVKNTVNKLITTKKDRGVLATIITIITVIVAIIVGIALYVGASLVIFGIYALIINFFILATASFIHYKFIDKNKKTSSKWAYTGLPYWIARIYLRNAPNYEDIEPNVDGAPEISDTPGVSNTPEVSNT